MVSKWAKWLTVWLTMNIGGLALSAMLYFQSSFSASGATRSITAVCSWLWLLYGLWCWRERRWVRVLSWLILGGWTVVLLYMATGINGYTIAFAGIWSTASLFFVSLGLLRLILRPGHAVIGIARTLLDEAIRMKIAIVFVVLLVMVVPVLFVAIDPNQRLEYRIQMFLTWSLTATSVFLSLMTIFLACATICGEFSQRQIFLTLTKPVTRTQYLLGKWLGIVLVNALLVIVASVGIYVFAKLFQQQPPRDGLDRLAVDTQVLVARKTVLPGPPDGMDLNARIESRRKKLEQQNAERFSADQVSRDDLKDMEVQEIQRWYTIPPKGLQRYMFEDLHDVKRYSDVVQLRFKPRNARSTPDMKVRLAFFLWGRPFPAPGGYHIQQEVSSGDFHVIPLPTEAINEDGQLELAIANVDLANPDATFPVSVSFPANEGLQILYQVGRFEPNFVRSMVIMWIRLAFLAALGIMASTFLGFPVACLLCLLIYVTASGGAFLSEAMTYYAVTAPEESTGGELISSFISHWFTTVAGGDIGGAIKMLVKLAGLAAISVIPTFQDFDPIPLVADGRLVPYDMIFSAIVKMGLLWTGIAAVIGILVFRRRELARVTV